MEEVDGPSRSNTMASRKYSQNSGSGRQPQLPQVSGSIYEEESSFSHPNTYAPSYGSHPPPTSTPGPASIDYLATRTTPSPTRLGGSSSQGHTALSGSRGESEEGHSRDSVEDDLPPRPLSPTEFGGGYNDRTTLGVVNR